MNAEDFLKQVKTADYMIEVLRAEERDLWALAAGASQTNDGMPHASGPSDKVGNIVQKLDEAKRRTVEKIAAYIQIRENVIRHIEMLPPKQCAVLHWLYVRKRKPRGKGESLYYTWQETAEALGCTQQNVDKLRKRAMKSLQKILDREEKGEKVD